MILGIDASNIRHGGGVIHLAELLGAADPPAYGFDQVIVWSGKATLDRLADRPWLVKAHDPALDGGFRSRLRWQRKYLSTAAKTAVCDLLFVPGGSYAGNFHPVITMSQNLLPFEWREIRRFGLSMLTLKWVILRWTQSRSFRRSDGVIFLTAYARDAVLRVTGTLACPTAIIPHGVGDDFFRAPRPQRPLAQYSAQEPFRMLYVSIIDMYKHQWNVVEAVGKLRRSGYPVTLELIGPAYGPALERLEAVMSRVDPRRSFVDYAGPVAPRDMHLRYAAADLAVFASSCETFGQIVTEAMSAGLPIACSNRSAMPELLGNAGVYFDPEDPTDITEALRTLVESAALRTEKAAACFDKVARYSWTRCARETLSFFEATLLHAAAGSRAKRGILGAHTFQEGTT